MYETKRFLSFTLIALMALVFVGFSSCSKDTAPSETDLFAGKYTSSISYIKGLESIHTENGYVIVTKI